jgi:hypothetical protein
MKRIISLTIVLAFIGCSFILSQNIIDSTSQPRRVGDSYVPASASISAVPSNTNSKKSGDNRFTNTATPDVTVGQPVAIQYSQIYPLLDGLFQDVSGMQISQLTGLNPNGANASNLDAVLQQFQASLQYSQTLGIQNQTAAQQNATYSANLVGTSNLINQELALQNSYFTFQQQLIQAQNDIGNSAPDSPELRAAEQRFASVNSNLTLVNQQLTAVRTMVGNASISSPTTFANTNPAPSSNQASPFMTPMPVGIVNNTNSPPSFPPSKQMENQVNLLWERLSYLVNTLYQSQEDNSHIYLVKFNTSINASPQFRKDQLLNTQYTLACTDPSKPKPMVLDVFPRMAAYNIADEHYHDSKTMLNAVMSFFGLGFSAGYSKEHLLIRQSLSQSAYVTGFGIQTSSFGWTFGPAFGERAPSPGSRTTFALVSIPNDCAGPSINLINSSWDKSPALVQTDTTPSKSWMPFDQERPIGDDRESLSSIACMGTINDIKSPIPCVRRISYRPLEFDPKEPAVSHAVTVDIILQRDIDREQIVSVNGKILKRARDSYGQGTANSTLKGLFQDSSPNIALDTWIPISGREMVLTLDAKDLVDQFPRMFINSSHGSMDLSAAIGNGSEVYVDARRYFCPKESTVSCSFLLPSMAREKSTVKQLYAARWVRNLSTGSAPSKDDYHLVIKVANGTANPVQNTDSSLPDFQVNQGSRDQPWSSNASVIASTNDGNDHVLQCMARGEFLDCRSDDFSLNQNASFSVYDGSFLDSPVKGSFHLEDCDGPQNGLKGPSCKIPVIMNNPQVSWDGIEGCWKFELEVINLQSGWNIEIAPGIRADNPFDNWDSQKMTPIVPSKSYCWNPNDPCRVPFKIKPDQFPLAKDTMQLLITEKIKDTSNYRIVSSIELKYLYSSMLPLLRPINGDESHLTGKNLVWNQVVVDKNDKEMIPYTCSSFGDDCTVDKSKFGNFEGYLYFKVNDTQIYLPLRYYDDTGVHTLGKHLAKNVVASGTTIKNSKSLAPAPSETELKKILNQVLPSVKLMTIPNN